MTGATSLRLEVIGATGQLGIVGTSGALKSVYEGRTVPMRQIVGALHPASDTAVNQMGIFRTAMNPLAKAAASPGSSQ